MSKSFAQNKYTVQVEFFPQNFQDLTYTHVSEFLECCTVKLGEQVKTFIENKKENQRKVLKE